MLKIVMIGVILLATLSCVSLDKTMMYAVNQEYAESATAQVNLDITSNHELVGEWNYEPDFLHLYDIPKNLRCVSEETWQTIVKPKLKEASRKYRDQQDKKAPK